MTQPSSRPRPSEWPDRLAKLYSAVVADVLDKLGSRSQCMDRRIRPLWPEARAAGFARTVQTVPALEVAPAHPYAGELAAVDSLTAGDVLVVSESAWSFWGELLSTAANFRGCRGVVLDGPTRDSAAIRAMGFPVFHVGFHPADSLGRLDVIGHNIPIECGGVLVNPGDLILADHDGVVVVPSAAAEETLRLAEGKVSGENLVRKALAEGMSTTEAFARYGIL
jgi:4-hydroxy-4-methyl-2-oxoglutarate aldolase